MGRQEVLPEAHSFAPFVKEEFCCSQDADLPNKELWSLDSFATTLSYTDIGQPSPYGTEEFNWIVKVGTALFHSLSNYLLIKKNHNCLSRDWVCINGRQGYLCDDSDGETKYFLTPYHRAS